MGEEQEETVIKREMIRASFKQLRGEREKREGERKKDFF